MPIPPTPELTDARRRAIEIAQHYPHEWIEPIHALKSILAEDGSVAAQAVEVAGHDLQKILGRIDEELDAMPTAPRRLEEPAESGALKAVNEHAEIQCEALGASRLHATHLLLSLCGVDGGLPGNLRKELRLNKRQILDAIKTVEATQRVREGKVRTSADKGLEFCENLTARAAQGELDPVFGRAGEISELTEILARRTKSNAMLVGPPGTGKTAVVAGLAQLLASPHAPAHLADNQIFELDLASMVAGAKYQGQFEERFKNLIKSMIQRGPSAVLFVDEMHSLMRAGKSAGGVDAANMLKPALARGELRLIGTTTTDEYREHIEKDRAFERRFSLVRIGEPDDAVAFEILEGLLPKYAKHHDVTVGPDAITAAVRLSRRYMTGRFLPDKAVDVLDGACADVRLLAQATEKWRKSEDEESKQVAHDELKTLVEKRALDVPATSGEWDQAAVAFSTRLVDVDVISRRVARESGVPVQSMSVSDRERLRDMESHLRKRIIGQTDAIQAVANAVRRARQGVKPNENAPDGSFLFLGSTGTGKTELAKALAEFLFGTESAMIRIDMSEYKDEHAVDRLTGPPPGLVGYERGGTLTEGLKHRPYSIVLFDEVDKADPQCLDILLAITDDGRLTDGKGTTVDCSNALFILTSNFQGTWIAKQFAKHGGVERQELIDRLVDAGGYGQTGLRPEMFNRLTDSIVFHPLSQEDIRQIVDLQVDRVIKRFSERGVLVYVTSEARDVLAKEGYSPEFGARPARRVIERRIVDPIALELSGLESPRGVEVTVAATKGPSGELEGIQLGFSTTVNPES